MHGFYWGRNHLLAYGYLCFWVQVGGVPGIRCRCFLPCRSKLVYIQEDVMREDILEYNQRKLQIIESELSVCKDEKRRLDLEKIKNDLIEFIKFKEQKSQNAA